MRRAIGALALAALLAAVGCARKPEPRPRLLIFGLDCATWTILGPMIEAGEVPTIARLTREGSYGVLTSVQPVQSPPVWTTVATGKLPTKHGIRDFIARVPGTDRTVPVSSNLRRVKAFWNILSERDISVGIVGWWPSWPAEEVNGFMVTDRAWPVAMSDGGVPLGTGRGIIADVEIPEFPGRTWPDSIFESFRPFIVLEKDVGPVELDRFFSDSQRVDAISDFYVRWVYARDRSFAEAGQAFWEREQPDVYALYLNGIDVAQHYFWGFQRDLGFAVNDKNHRLYGEVVRNFYRYADRVIASHLAKAPEDVTVLIVSDHGFETKGGLRQAWERGEEIRTLEGAKDVPWDHAIEGVIIVSGPGIRRDFRIEKASATDVAPTILAYCGLPVGRDMDGRPLEAAFEPEFLKKHPISFVDTYETGAARVDTIPRETPMDEAAKERLKSLGYLGG
jgi:predicted AlkP superfamily pyrophosphatase or phosphodiesterase